MRVPAIGARLPPGPGAPGRPPPKATRIDRMAVMSDVFVLTVHAPYDVPDRPPVTATIVSAKTLLHPRVPQPAGRRLHDGLTRPPRMPDELVPVSTLAFEQGGDLSARIPGWQAITLTLVELARAQACDAIPMTLPAASEALLVNGPESRVTLHDRSNGRSREYGPDDRARVLADLQAHVDAMLAQGPFWPGFEPSPEGA